MDGPQDSSPSGGVATSGSSALGGPDNQPLEVDGLDFRPSGPSPENPIFADTSADDDPHPWRAQPPTVGAVVVVHHGERWLSKTLASFAQLEYGPTAWRVVDVGSTGRGAAMVRESFGADRVLYAGSGTGFGDAVRRGIEALPDTDWIWLLHDDAVVAPDALLGLLDEATTSDDIAAVGPKIREWPSLRRLLEVGVTITPVGSRETLLESGEPDAGQHDWPEDVLAVSSAGMLVRRSAWEQLGGFDPALPLFFDDIDFGWRAALAGLRIRTAPGGVIFHAEASRRGARRRGAGDAPRHEKRRAALYTVLTNTRGRRLAWIWVRLVLGSLVRVIGLAMIKDTRRAGDEWAALRHILSSRRQIREARVRKGAQASRGHGDIAHLLAPWWLPYRHALDSVGHLVTTLVRPESVETAGRRSTVGVENPDDGDLLETRVPLWRRRPWFGLVVVMAALSLLGHRSLLADSGPLAGGALPPAPDNAGQWWSLILGATPDVGLGSISLAPTYVGLLAVVASPLWGVPDLLVWVLMVFCVPLAAMTAHRLGRLLTDQRAPRMVWAVAYGLFVAASGAVAEGRLGTVVALILLPVIVNAALHWSVNPGWRAALVTAMWVSAAAAFAPVLFWMTVPFVLIAAVTAVVPRRDLAVFSIFVVLLLGPTLWQRVLSPVRWWWEAGYPIDGSADLWHVVAGRGGTLGAPWWIAVPILAVGLASLAPARTRDAVLRCWIVAVIGLAFALAGSVTTYQTGSGASGIVAWVAVPAVIWVAALATAVLIVTVEPRALGATLARAVVALTMVTVVGTAVWWIADGADGPLGRDTASVVPAFLDTRPGDTLVLTGQIDSGVRTRVVRGAGPFLGQEALRPDPAAAERLQEAVEGLLTRSSPDDVQTLSDLGISAVYAPSVDPAIGERIDAAPRLERSGSDSPGSRAWLVPSSGPPLNPSRAWPERALAAAPWLVWAIALVALVPVRRPDPEPDEVVDLDDEPIRIS